MKIKNYSILLLLPVLFSCSKPADIKVQSPDKHIQLSFSVNEQGQPVYSVSTDDSIVIEQSALGLNLTDTNLAGKLEIESVSPSEQVTDQYSLNNDKKSRCTYLATRQSIHFKEKDGLKLSIDFQVSNDGVAFRYLLTGNPEEVITIETEATTFNLPETAKGWLHPHAKAQTGWANTQPSYEEYYETGIKAGTESPLGEGWSFPALFHSAGRWIQITEAGMGRNYCGSHLGHLSPNGEYSIAFAQSPEKTTEDAALLPQSAKTIKSPWRIIGIGKSLGTIVESTLTTDLSEPAKFAETEYIHPGKASWSWVLLKDGQTIYSVQKQFIDYAADMGWDYCLIDALWDTQIGYEKIEELAQYAATKNVGLILWYNSNGSWNEAPQTPLQKMFDPEIRRAEFARLNQMGIKGLKIDFFGGDGQSFMNYYQDILEDAAQAKLLINFHGTTIPRGWNRTYPNLMTMEAVRGMEFLTFEQANTDHQPTHCAILPFTRNAVGPMDFTPVCFSEIPGLERKTTNGFELALSVLFQSGIQHYAEVPEGMYKQPAYVIDWMKSLPKQWDDVKFIDGYPGEFAVIARKAGDKWYLAGINGSETTKELTIKLADFNLANGAALITDGDTKRSFKQEDVSGETVRISMLPHGGFVIK